jgi:hypothetical protein
LHGKQRFWIRLAQPLEFAFTVGAAEQHAVEFSRGGLWGTVRVTVDGVEALSQTDPPLSVDRTRRYELTVGEDEPHAVVIEKQRPRWFGGLRPNTYRVFVDGQFTATHEGR